MGDFFHQPRGKANPFCKMCFRIIFCSIPAVELKKLPKTRLT